MPGSSPRTLRVLDQAGRPVADAFVTVVAGTAPTPEVILVTDPAGCARLGLPAGHFRILVRGPDGRQATVEVEGGVAEEIVLRLPPPVH